MTTTVSKTEPSPQQAAVEARARKLAKKIMEGSCLEAFGDEEERADYVDWLESVLEDVLNEAVLAEATRLRAANELLASQLQAGAIEHVDAVADVARREWLSRTVRERDLEAMAVVVRCLTTHAQATHGHTCCVARLKKRIDDSDRAALDAREPNAPDGPSGERG